MCDRRVRNLVETGVLPADLSGSSPEIALLVFAMALCDAADANQVARAQTLRERPNHRLLVLRGLAAV